MTAVCRLLADRASLFPRMRDNVCAEEVYFQFWFAIRKILRIATGNLSSLLLLKFPELTAICKVMLLPTSILCSVFLRYSFEKI